MDEMLLIVIYGVGIYGLAYMFILSKSKDEPNKDMLESMIRVTLPFLYNHDEQTDSDKKHILMDEYPAVKKLIKIFSHYYERTDLLLKTIIFNWGYALFLIVPIKSSYIKKCNVDRLLEVSWMVYVSLCMIFVGVWICQKKKLDKKIKNYFDELKKEYKSHLYHDIQTIKKHLEDTDKEYLKALEAKIQALFEQMLKGYLSERIGVVFDERISPRLVTLQAAVEKLESDFTDLLKKMAGSR